MKSDNPRGSLARPLLESEIKAAMSISKSASEVSRRLGVHYNTYKKWSKRYGLHDDFVKKSKTGIKRPNQNPNKGVYPLTDILAGKYPNFPTYRFKNKLFKSSFKEKKCECCGWDKSRESDGNGPFIIDYIDGDPRNKELANIRILCLNCTYIERGFINRGRNDLHQELNLDKMQREKARVVVEVVDVDDIEIDINELTEEEIKQIYDSD